MVVEETPEEAQRKLGYEVVSTLVPTLQDWFRDQYDEKQSNVDPVLFTRMACVALLNAAAVLGVDVGMQPQQFLSVCDSCYNDASVKAPRFA